jgi:thioredoxin 1
MYIVEYYWYKSQAEFSKFLYSLMPFLCYDERGRLGILKGDKNMADVVFTDQNFDAEVLKSNIPVLVDFWAVWCGPCQMQGPIVEEVAEAMAGKAKVGKLNVDENPQFAQKFQVMSIPTLLIFKNGNVVKQFIGVQSKDTLTSELNKVLA